MVLKYSAQARARNLGVVFITHNVHHAYAIGGRFTLLNRGTTYGTFAKSDVNKEELMEMMAGGRDLADLTQELGGPGLCRSEEHTSELQSLMRISYAVFCLQKNKRTT